MLPMKTKFTGLIALSTRIPKIKLLAREAPISGEGRPENLGKTGQKQGEWSILIGNTGLYSLVSKFLQYFGFPAC